MVDTGSERKKSVRRPTTADVLPELQTLRTYYGVSRERIRTEAPILQQLDATTDEMERLGLESHVAAFDILRCTVEHEIHRTDFRLILSATLNFSGARSNLTVRQEDARMIMAIKKRAADNLMAEAYGELAAVLASLSKSPCRPRDTPLHERDDVIGVIIDQTEQLISCLRLLTMESRPEYSNLIAEQAFQTLPNALAYVESHPEFSELSRVEQLFRILILLVSRQPGVEYPVIAVHLLALLDPAVEPIQRHFELAEALHDVVPGFVDDGRLTDTFYESKGAVLEVAEMWANRVEANGEWRRVLGRGGAQPKSSKRVDESRQVTIEPDEHTK